MSDYEINGLSPMIGCAYNSTCSCLMEAQVDYRSP